MSQLHLPLSPVPPAPAPAAAVALQPVLQALLEEFIANQNSIVTQRVYAYELRRFFLFTGRRALAELTPRDVLAYKESISRRAPATIAWRLCAVRQFLEFAHQRGHLSTNLMKGVKSPKVHQKEPEFLTVAEARALLNAPDRRTLKGKRDHALLHLMLSTGIRVGELVAGRVEDLGVRYNKPVLRVIGKGQKPRTLRLAPEAQEALAACLAGRPGLKTTDPLFVTTPRRGETPRPLTPRAVQKLIKSYAAQALIQKTVTPHTLRHTVASLELEGGANVKEIQEQLGHSSISVTNRYLHTRGEALEKHPLYNNGPLPAALR